MATTVSTRHVQEDVVTALRRSRERHGEIPGHPIIRTQDGVILDGNHRKKAGFTETITVRVKDEVELWEMRWVLVMAQRTATFNEQAEIVNNLCEALERSGVPTEEIARLVVKNELYARNIDMTEQYIYRMIPNRFKRSGGYERTKQTLVHEDVTPGRNFEIADDEPDTGPRLVECDFCHHKGIVIAGHLQDPA